jgi:uncharacterized protein YfdQ (DUF2303 family)
VSEEKTEHEESFVGGIPAAIWAGRRIGALEAGVKVLDVHGVPAIVSADDLSVDFREDLRERPRRINATRNFREVASFSAYVNAFGNDHTRIYAASTMTSIKAVIDDHEAVKDGKKDAPTKATPNWCGHEAVLCLEPSEEWSAWMALNKKPLKHLDFVEFLQERIGTIAKPDASGIVQAARAFSASRNAKFEQVLPVEGGDISVSYSEEVRGTTKNGQAALPQALTLMLRPYRSGKAYPVEAQVRWRLSREGDLTFSFALLETERVIETAFEDVRKEIAAATDITVLV